MTQKKIAKGFTLIELLVVISIIAILSSIVMSQLKNARIRAEDLAKIQDMRLIKNAALEYMIDRDTLPPVNNGTNNGIGSLEADLYAPLISGGYLRARPQYDPAFYVHKCNNPTTPCSVPAGTMTNTSFFTSCPTAEAEIIFTLQGTPPFGTVPWGSYYALCF